MTVALLSLFVGIVLGDLGLYALGGLARQVGWIDRLLPPRRQDMMRGWLSGRVFRVVLVSRFLPGMRLPTYTTCGFLRANLKQFALAAIVATLCWTSLLFGASLRVGQFLIDHFGAWRWAGAAGFVVFVIVAGRVAALGIRQRAAMKLETALSQPHAGTDPRAAPVVSFFEFWPGWAFYAPVAAHWIALGLRYGSFSLPTAANPNIALGGLCGESKRSILDQVAPAQRGLLARYAAIVTHAADPRADLAAAEAADRGGRASAIHWSPSPTSAATAPASGWSAQPAELLRYLAAFPRNEGVLLQEFLPQDGEAGLFYVREPGERAGRITSVTLKYPPERHRRRALHAAGADPGRSARRPGAAALPAAADGIGCTKCPPGRSTCGWCSSATTARARSSATAAGWRPRR